MTAKAKITLEVLAAAAPVLVQDGGRPGYLHHGVPTGGALVPELLAVANRAAGNYWHAPALEIYGEVTLLLHGGPVWIALDETAWQADTGAVLSIKGNASRYVSYLAVQGGINVPPVLGGRGTLLTAELGGFDGRVLRRGDLLHTTTLQTSARQSFKDVIADIKTPLRLIPGPDQIRFDSDTYATLFNSAFTVSAARNRVGMRLTGPRIERRDDDSAISTPMARGALQVPASGELIVLGPDHPTTGGYPVIACVIRADWGRISARLPGTAVCFQEVTLAEARAAWRRYTAQFLE